MSQVLYRGSVQFHVAGSTLIQTLALTKIMSEKREKISYIWKLVDEHPVDESKPICKLQTHEDWPHIHNIPNFIVS